MKASEFYEDQLPADIASMAMANLIKQDAGDPHCANLIDALSQFKWQDTDEGWRFWCDVASGNVEMHIGELCDRAAQRMINRGDAFSASLGRTYTLANPSHKCRLISAFSTVFKKYF